MKMYRAVRMYTAWTIHGYIGTALLITIKAESCDRKDLWFQQSNQGMQWDCHARTDIANTMNSKWSLAREPLPKQIDDTSEDVSRLLDGLSSSRECLDEGMIAFGPSSSLNDNTVSTEPEPFCTQKPQYNQVDTVRISEDDADLLPSAVLAEQPSSALAVGLPPEVTRRPRRPLRGARRNRPAPCRVHGDSAADRPPGYAAPRGSERSRWRRRRRGGGGGGGGQ